MAWWGGHKVVDPTEIESRFSNEDGFGAMGISYHEHMDEEAEKQMEKVMDALDRIPTREADFIDLYVFKKRKQTDIATIFGVSQPTVSYRLKRAEARIKYLIELPNLADGELERVLNDLLEDPLDIQIMLLMYDTTCQSEVAKLLGVSQGLVRHRFLRSIRAMGWESRAIKGSNGKQVRGPDGKPLKEWIQVSDPPKLAKYADIFKFVHDNLNILREVQRPQWNAVVTHMLG